MAEMLTRRALLGAAMTLPTLARGNDWSPSRPIEFLVSFPPGGTADAIARLLTADLGERKGWPCVVVNKPGGGGSIMQRSLAGSAGDGQVLGVCASYQLVYSPEGYGAPPFGIDSFQYLAGLASSPMCVVARAESQIRSIDQLRSIAAAKGSLTIGVTPPFNWLGERLGSDLGIKLVSIPYKGSGELLPALLGGHIDLSLSSGGHIPYERSGAMRVIVALTHGRLPANPDVPTVRELGGRLLIESRFLVLAPKALGKEQAFALTLAIEESATSPRLQPRLATSLGLSPVFTKPGPLLLQLQLEAAAAKVQEDGAKARV